LIFQYRNEETGKVVEHDFPFGKTPPSTVEEGGRVYHRVFNVPGIVYGASFNTEGQIKFKRPPLESDGFDYT
jgi:hypothetical protein